MLPINELEGKPAAPESTVSLRRVFAVVAVALVVFALALTAAWRLRGLTISTARTELNSAASNDELRKQGRLLYLTSCAGCHGPEGHGDGPTAAELKPPPRDLTQETWKFGTSRDAVRQVIRDGIPGTPMPGSPLLSERELEALVAHVRAWAPAATPLAETAALLKRAGFAAVEAPRTAPSLDLRGLDGSRRSLSDFKGKVVLLNFWATTCIHCLDELPELDRLGREYHDQGLVVVSVCFDDSTGDSARKLVRGRAPHLPVFVNPDGLARFRYDVQIMPVVYLIDAEGRVLGHTQGLRRWVDRDIQFLLQACRGS